MQEKRINELVTLQKTLDYNFNDLKLLNKALTHKSYANETNPPVKNNERFEFLGDSVIDLIISKYIVLEYEDLVEGTYFESIDHFKDELFDFLVYYNELRPHQGINGVTPSKHVKKVATN